MPHRVRILYLDNSYTFGGAIHALSHLVGALDSDRYEPVVLSAQPPEVLHRLFPGIETHHQPMRVIWAHGRGMKRLKALKPTWLNRTMRKGYAAWWLLFVDLPAMIRIARFARRRRVQLVHLNNGVTGHLPGLLAGKLLRVPVVGHYRAAERTSGNAARYARWVDRWISVSGVMSSRLLKAGVAAERVHTVHDALDLKSFTDPVDPGEQLRLRAGLGIPADSPVFGIFGRIIRWKGIREFVLAAARVLERDAGAVALVVGDRSDGSEAYFEGLVQLTRDLNIEERVIFTGYREDVPSLMRLCDVVVHASLIPEPFGMTVIEGMAAGAAVVAANTGGPTEIIDPGATGLLVDPTDTEALAEAIGGFLLNPSRRAEFGRRAAARAREHYSAERYADEVQTVYELVMSRQ